MTLVEKLQARIVEIDAAIVATQQRALADIAELRGNKATLQAAIAALGKAPEAEQLIPALQQLGVL